jgi:hypothetical protein
MDGASGEWRLRSIGREIGVTFRLHIEPGRVPKGIANRQLAETVGGTVANLQRRFPCSDGGQG